MILEKNIIMIIDKIIVSIMIFRCLVILIVVIMEFKEKIMFKNMIFIKVMKKLNVFFWCFFLG